MSGPRTNLGDVLAKLGSAQGTLIEQKEETIVIAVRLPPPLGLFWRDRV
jgi:hypothetical protein